MVPFTVIAMIYGFLIMIAFVPDIVGAVVPTNWSVMWLATPILLLKCQPEMTSIHWLGLAFLFYASLSLLWSPHGSYALLQLLALASVFVWASTIKDLRSLVIGLSIGLGVSAVIAILQYFDINLGIFKLTAKPSGLFVNSNIFAETSGMLLTLIMIYKLWWFIPVTMPGLLVSSRAVILGLGVTFLVWAWSKSKILAISCAVFAGLTVAHVDRFGSILLRFDVWKDTISGFTISGHGIGSFEYLFLLYSHIDDNSIRFFNPHNDILQLIFELGAGAIPLFMAVAILLKVNDAHKYPLTFFIIIGLFGFPLSKPVTAFMAAIVAGYLASRRMAHSSIGYNSRPILYPRQTA